MAMENPVYFQWKFTSIKSTKHKIYKIYKVHIYKICKWVIFNCHGWWHRRQDESFPLDFNKKKPSQICQGSSWLSEPCCVAACGKTAGMKIWGCHQCHLYGRNLHENPIPPPLQSHHGGWGWNHNIWDQFGTIEWECLIWGDGIILNQTP